MVAAEQGDSTLLSKIEDDERACSSTGTTASKEQTKTEDSGDSGSPGESVTKTVTSVVKDIVNDVSTASALENEKAKVQKLINGLVARAREDALSGSNGDTPGANMRSTDSQNDASLKDSGPKGVPENDYRPRKIANVPLEWAQARHSVTLQVRVPSWVTKRHVTASFQTNKLKLKISQQDDKESAFFSLDKTLFGKIDEDGSVWALDAHAATVLIELEKADSTWWFTLFDDDDPSDYQIVDESRSEAEKPVEHKMSNGSSGTNGDNDAENEDNVDSSSRMNSSEGELMDVIDVTSGTGKKVGRESANGNERGMTVEKAVAGVVKNVVEDASRENIAGRARAQASAKGAVNETEASTIVEDEDDDEIRPGRATGSSSSSAAGTGRRVLTRADLPKLIEESKATIEKGGEHAAEAAVQLATFYHYGIGVKQDDAEAVRLFKRGLEGGVKDASAAFQLGLIYNTGAPGVTPDAEEAVRWWRVAASYQNAVAMFNLGVMAMNGSGCEMDPVAAMDWFQRAKKLDPKLDVPQLSRGQLDQRMALADRLRKQRKKREIAPEEWQKRKEDALQNVRMLGYTTAGLIGLGLSVVAIRYWWRNRL